ncbi:L-type lectin-domain containing protein [Catalinimonas niigatensis]|uniref:L-type lectin-domain containing protein n=1 Tax=Catalinimonas niigatensis TaxID=1397264 RepID=UPI002665D54E|nr:L-type lectin-domain containing protein [Catalinimonas niigatensis]WPP49932.1 L-type lectin-domain containing protein [Catalinimonas niigatensis]
MSRSFSLLCTLACITFAPIVNAQFELMGTADYMPSGCIMLTPNEPYAEGIAYSTTKLNLADYFEIEFDIYLGDKDEYGADGIAFVIHDDPRGFNAFGTYGEGIGYGRFNPAFISGNFIAPSVAVEFDTYQNAIQNDPAGDHVAFLENGSSFHEKYWNGGNENLNLEDDRMHNFRFGWNPETKEIIVRLDNNIVFQGTKNLVEDYFDGETEVIWGFTSSTGRKYNLQYFCFRRIAYRKPNIDIKQAEAIYLTE